MNDLDFRYTDHAHDLSADEASLLLDALRSTFGTRAEVARLYVLKRRRDYLVLAVGLVHPNIPLTIKLAGPQPAIPCPFQQTAALLKLVGTESAVPVPVSEVLAVGVSQWNSAWTYLIKRYLPGQEWAVAQYRMSKNELDDAYEQMGRVIGELHTFQFPHFGEISVGSEDGTLAVAPASYVQALRERAMRRITNIAHAELFSALLEEKAYLFEEIAKSSLCHEDLHGHNILFNRYEEEGLQKWRLTGILDFDSAWAGCSESDLARLELWRGMIAPSFWNGYRERNDVSERYPQRRPIYQLMWCLEYDSTAPEHLADIESVCAAMNLPSTEYIP